MGIVGETVRVDDELGHEHPHLATRRALLMPRIGERILDGERMLRRLSRSAAVWTAVRLPRMTDDDPRAVSLARFPASPEKTVGYASAASAIVEEVFARRWPAAAPFATTSW